MSTLPLILVAVGCAVAAAIFLVAGLRTKPSSEQARYLVKVTRDVGRSPTMVDDSSSFADRVLSPIMRGLMKVGWALTPSERLAQLEDRLEAAGNPAGWDINRLILLKVLGLFTGVAFGLLVTLNVNTAFGLIVIVAFGALGFFMPDIIMKSIAQKRTDEMRRTLADTVDILNLTLEAGIGFDSAMKLVAEYTNGPLANEFNRVVQEITIGKTRSEALHALAGRTKDEDLRRFCLTCVQAERRGTPLGEILRIQANELRIKRRQLAEERAQKVPVKILFPLMVFVLPVLMLIVMGPAIYKIMESGLGSTGGG